MSDTVEKVEKEIIQEVEETKEIDEKEELENTVQQLERLIKLSPGLIRQKAEKVFSLTKGIEQYKRCYAGLLFE